MALNLEETYGAELDTVRSVVPSLTIAETSNPSAEQVEGFIELIAGEVAVVVESLEGLGYSAGAVTRAKGNAKLIVALGAAAMAVDAAYPNAGGRGASNLGETLWARYEKRLDGLVDRLDLDEDDGTDVPAHPVESPAYSFPPASFTTRTGF